MERNITRYSIEESIYEEEEEEEEEDMFVDEETDVVGNILL